MTGGALLSLATGTNTALFVTECRTLNQGTISGMSGDFDRIGPE